MHAIDYPVRTPAAYWPVALAITALCVAGLVTVASAGPGLLLRADWPTQLLVALMLALPPIYILTTGEYRARGRIRVGLDAVEVPDARGQPLRFDPRQLELRLTHVTVRYTLVAIPVADVRRGTVLDLRGGGLRRRISTLTLVERDHSAALLADLERVRRGEAPLGPHARVGGPAPPPRPQTELERQLDRELAALD